MASGSFAPYGWWPLAILAVAALSWTVHAARGLVAAILTGWSFGLTFMLTSLHWQTNILIASYLGLSLATSLLYAAVGGLLKLVEPLPGAVVWSAGAWSVGEWVLSVWPFEGFMWMRWGYAFVDSPLAGYYPFIGAAGVSFLVGMIGALLTWAVETPSWRRTAGALVAGVGIFAGGFAGTTWSPASAPAGTVSVGWVQGGAPGGGVYGLGPARTITKNQAEETAVLMERVAAGEEAAPSFMVWPENSTDLDPRADAQTQALVQGAVEAAGLPILVGSVYQGPGTDERQTVSVWWTTDGPQDVYAKQNLVPFGEWIPFRDVLLPLIPELRYVGNQSVPGTEPGLMEVALPSGEDLGVGVAICYEVLYPGTLSDAASAGADVFVVMSSNAMYQETNQIDQQFAITRVRAAEMRRDILVVTTSGVSGRIGSHGQIMWTAPDHVAASGVEEMPLQQPTTPVMVWGTALEWGLALLGGLSALAGAAHRIRFRAGGTMGDAPARTAGQ